MAPTAQQPYPTPIRPVEHVNFRPGPIGRDLLERGSPSSVAKRMAERYLLVVAGALDGVTFTPDEALVLVTALRNAVYDADTADGVGELAIRTATQDRLADLHGVDLHALRRKLAGLSRLQGLALIDATERFWRDPDRRDALARTGLVA